MSLFHKKQKNTDEAYLVSPVDGEVMSLSQVPDPVFADKMMGDGIAVLCQGDTVCAPADGTITLIAKTSHAFGMTLHNGLELFVHVGLETVNLNGKGFTVLCEAGKKVKQGEPILKIDLSHMKEHNISLITPVILLNHQEHPFEDIHEEALVKAGVSRLLRLC